MNENAFYKLVSDTADEYTRILAEVQASLKKAPEGNLHIIKKNGKPYYYLQKRIAKNKYALTYIPKKNRKLLSALAQKKYDKKILPMVKENLKAINELLDNYEFGLLEEEYNIICNPDDYCIDVFHNSVTNILKAWKEEVYPENDRHNENKIFETENGEWVRSKSEMIIANALRAQSDSLLYKYERPLKMRTKNGMYTIYPDFTIINIHTGRIYFWEHFGMIGDPEYTGNAIDKINTFAQNGISMGKNLFITFECQNHPLSTQCMRDVIEQML